MPTQNGAVRSASVLLAAVAILATALVPRSAHAASFTVKSTGDGHDVTPGNGVCETAPGNGVCTLRAAIEEANALAGSDGITVPSGTYTLTLGELLIASDLSLNGAGAGVTVIDANHASRVVEVASGTVALTSLTLQNGTVTGDGGDIDSSGTLSLTGVTVQGGTSSGCGGGVASSGPIALTTVVVSSNTAVGGGGVCTGGGLTMAQTAIRGNTATGSGGGGLTTFGGTIVSSEISGNTTSASDGGGAWLNGTVTIDNSTVSGNTAQSRGGGLYAERNVSVTVRNSTVAGNGAVSTFGDDVYVRGDPNALPITWAHFTDGASIFARPPDIDIDGTCASLGYNVNGCGNGPGEVTAADPKLGPLAANGGPTQTRALLAGSPAIDAVDGCPPPSTDQRGVVRPQGLACEAGAYEAPAQTFTPTQTAYFTWFDRISDPGFVGDNIHVVNPSSVPVSARVTIPGFPGCTLTFAVPAYLEKVVSCATGFGGPVKVESNGPVVASQRVQFNQSFNEILATPASAAATSLTFTWFDRISSAGFMADNIHVVNPGTSVASATVSIRGCAPQVAAIAAQAEQLFTCATGFGGPVTVTSTGGAVIASQRVRYYQSFNEVPATAPSAAGATLTLSWFDRVSSPGFVGDNVHVVNPNGSPVDVTAAIPGCANQVKTVAAQAEAIFTCAVGFGGPVTVTATQPVLASQRVQYYQSFNEVVGRSDASASTSSWFTWFDRVSSPGFVGDNVHVVNRGGVAADVGVIVPGCGVLGQTVAPGAEAIFTCSSGFGGPVEVTSTQPVLASQRVQYYQSFNEVPSGS